MRAFLLSCTLVMGCATIPPTPGDEPDCITVIQAANASQVYHKGERVLDDDLVVATEDSLAANTLAIRARQHEWYAIGSFVLGGVFLVPGIGLTAAGGAEHSTPNLATGIVLGTAGIGGIVAGALLIAKAKHENGRAVETFNEERHHCK